MDGIETVTSAEFQTRALQAPGSVVVDFYQASCAPCRALEPRLERVVRQFHDTVPVYRVDIDRDLPIAQRMGVRSLPTVLVLRAGQEVERLDGLITEPELAAAFERAAARPAAPDAPDG
jgi:thioredoxin 1